MRPSTPSAIAASLALTTVLAAVPLASRAASHSSLTFAVDNCNGALPGFEGAFRKRPLGIANEGSANAFLSCSINTDEATNTGTRSGALFLTNRASNAQAITCTMIDGLSSEIAALAGMPQPVYRAKTIGLASGQAAALQWLPGDFGVVAFSRYISFTCNVPVGVEINIAGSAWNDEPLTP